MSEEIAMSAYKKAKTADGKADANAASIASLTNYIKGTTQTYVFNTDDTIASITHKDANNNVVRTDVFTYGVDTITEVRTLASGGTITIVFNTTTFQTEVQ